MNEMGSKPPYTITEKAADYLAKIAETVTRLEFGTDFKRDIKLHRENRVRTIHSSLAIEGNSLTLGEVTAVIEGKVVAGKQTEIKEVKNAYEAYDKIMSFDPYAITDFLKAHKLMTQGLVKESGKFRKGDCHPARIPQRFSSRRGHYRRHYDRQRHGSF
jgi:Fic family protein